MKGSSTLYQSRKNHLPLDKKVLSEFKRAVEVSDMPLAKIARKHFRVTSQTLKNILNNEHRFTHKKTISDINEFIKEVLEEAGKKIDHIETGSDNTSAMPKHEHDIMHGARIMHMSYRTITIEDLQSAISSIKTVATSNLGCDEKVEVIKTIANIV